MARKTTEQFIKDAVGVHGESYDYSRADYKGSKIKIEIGCPDHGIFWQSPNDHLTGKGCTACGVASTARANSSTAEQFISRSEITHKGFYDYSKVDYKGVKIKVEIICPDHGSFWQHTGNHMRGEGCPECGGNATYNTEQFISRSEITHKGFYDYSKVAYKNIGGKVEIICPDHGSFWQAAGNHMRGVGCRPCANDSTARANTSNTADFINRAEDAHKGFYDYSKVEYKHNALKVEIICPDHGSFWQIPNDHLRGSGCAACVGNVPLSTEQFISRSEITHKGFYDYSRVKCKTRKIKVEIICPDHGSFWQPAGNHLCGHGCPSCAVTGYDTGKEGLLYYLRVTDSAGAIRYKIGITNLTVQDRFSNPDLEMIDILGEYRHGNGWAALNKETFVLGHFKHARYKGPRILKDGNTEIFNYDVLGLEDGGDLLLAVNRLQRDVIRRQVA